MPGIVFKLAIMRWCINRRKLDFGFIAKLVQARSIHPDYHLLTAEYKLQEKGFQVFSPGQ
jgi:hypothetical protein